MIIYQMSIPNGCMHTYIQNKCLHILQIYFISVVLSHQIIEYIFTSLFSMWNITLTIHLDMHTAILLKNYLFDENESDDSDGSLCFSRNTCFAGVNC